MREPSCTGGAQTAVVAKAKFNGLTDGRTSRLFDPYGTATRGHAAKMLYEVLSP